MYLNWVGLYIKNAFNLCIKCIISVMGTQQNIKITLIYERHLNATWSKTKIEGIKFWFIKENML